MPASYLMSEIPNMDKNGPIGSQQIMGGKNPLWPYVAQSYQRPRQKSTFHGCTRWPPSPCDRLRSSPAAPGLQDPIDAPPAGSPCEASELLRVE